MGTTVHLVRHCPQPGMGSVLEGRRCDAPLDSVGRAAARKLAKMLGETTAPVRIDSGPRRRATETATIVARVLGVPVHVTPALDELDYGEWTGQSFAELEGDVRWRFWNAARDRACSPGGETMYDAMRRAVAHVEACAAQAEGGSILCVTHADVIRGMIAHYLGLRLDRVLRIDIDPGSVSTIVVDRHGGRVALLNSLCA